MGAPPPPLPSADGTEGAAGPASILHATTLAAHGRGVIILGSSGLGKSGLALELMALGAALVADDRTLLTRGEGQALIAAAPPGLPPLIEARGIGLLNVALHPPVPLALAVDLAELETHRLPPHRHITIMGRTLPLVLRVADRHFAAALMQYLLAGRAG